MVMKLFNRLRRKYSKPKPIHPEYNNTNALSSINLNLPKQADNDRISPMPQADHGHGHGYNPPDPTRNLPETVLTRIFALVCPHAVDSSYEKSEESMTEDGCMLCDMRDLAHCALVCKRWNPVATELLYSHVRIDPVHYCSLELELDAKRTTQRNQRNNHRSSFFSRRHSRSRSRSADPFSDQDPDARLHLFMRSVRDNPHLCPLVLSLRTPYMTREANKADLARTVSVLPNLRFVDLPNGVFADDPSCYVLKRELVGRCLDLRRFAFWRGSEGSFSLLAHSATAGGAGLWRNLEVLELSGLLQVETRVFRGALASFPNLRVLALVDLPGLDDSAFLSSSFPTSTSSTSTDDLPPFPAVHHLLLRDTPNVSISALLHLLSRPAPRNALRHLSLSATAIPPHSLHAILESAPNLRELAYSQEVGGSFPVDSGSVPPLRSGSLRVLRYEISPSSSLLSGGNRSSALIFSTPASASASTTNFSSTATATPQLLKPYYAYLLTSLISNSLPALSDLYVLDPELPDTLLLSPPPPPPPRLFHDSNPFSNKTLSPNTNPTNPTSTPIPIPSLTNPLNIYSKPPTQPEQEWNLTPYEPPTPSPSTPSDSSSAQPRQRNRNRNITRPVSWHSAQLSQSQSQSQPWGGGGGDGNDGGGGNRGSVLVGNGFGGFLAVPDERGGNYGGGYGGYGRRPRSSAGTGSGSEGLMKRRSRGDLWR